MNDVLRANWRFLVVMAVVLLVWCAFLPLMLLLDHHQGRSRPMYRDQQRMARLQYDEVRRNGRPLTGTVASGQSVQVGGRTFVPSEGVTVTTEASDDKDQGTGHGKGYCVSATNKDGDKARRQCWDGRTDPATVSPPVF